MALRAKQPEKIEKRLKCLVFGDPGAGKTTCAAQFPQSYFVDCERGAENYDDILKKSKSVVFQTSDAEELIAEVRALATEKHEYRTLVVDPINVVEDDLILKANNRYRVHEKEAGDMRVWRDRDYFYKRLFALLFQLDMNVIMTCHGKVEYGDNMTKLGTTHAGWKRLPYMFDLVVEIKKLGTGAAAKRTATIRKSRLKQFKDGAQFDWSYEAIASAYGSELLSRAAVPITLATPEQIVAIQTAITKAKLPDAWLEEKLEKAGVESLEDMPRDWAEALLAKIPKA